MQKEEANLKIILSFLLNQYGQDILIFNMNTTSLKNLPDPKFKLTPFYKNILDTWFELSPRTLHALLYLQISTIFDNNYYGETNTYSLRVNVLYLNRG